MSTRGESKEAGPQDARPETVFGAPDQAEMVARLDAVADDDLDSDFFAAAVNQAEDSGARLFDVGIRTLAEEADAEGNESSTSRAGSPFVGGVSTGDRAMDPESRTLRVPLPERDADAVTVEIDHLGPIDFSDPDLRAAFVLGGPAAILRRG